MASRPISGTSSRSSTSKPGNSGESRAHSAIHVLTGAVTNVLGPRRFTFANARVLKFRSEAPLSAQEVGKIEAAANRKVEEDAEIVEFSMDKGEAEGHFGTGIYDLCPAPQNETLLRIVRIPDWGASCCDKSHTESTGSIGAIRVDACSFDEKAKELELKFHLL